jgi:uncharacterized OB-fold protein
VTDDVLTLKHFFEEARAGRLTGIRCGKCGELAIPPKEFCPSCQERDWAPVALGGKGAVTSFTVIRIPPRGRAGESPYAVAVVRLDEGVSLLGRIVDVPLENVRTGLAVRFRPLMTGEQTAVGFGPA